MSEKIKYGNREWSPESLVRFKEYQKEYLKETYKQMIFKFGKIQDADVLAMLNSQDSAVAYVKSLIRKDMEEKGIDVEALIEQYDDFSRKPGRPKVK